MPIARIKCPKCGNDDQRQFFPATKQRREKKGENVTIVHQDDLGVECCRCGEIFPDPFLTPPEQEATISLT